MFGQALPASGAAGQVQHKGQPKILAFLSTKDLSCLSGELGLMTILVLLLRRVPKRKSSLAFWARLSHRFLILFRAWFGFRLGLWFWLGYLFWLAPEYDDIEAVRSPRSYTWTGTALSP
jgi:hypothetical protein